MILLFCIPFFSFSQEDRGAIHISLTLNQQALELDKKYYIPNLEDSISFETVKFYIGHLQFFQDEQEVSTLDKKYFLVDAEKPGSLHIPIPGNVEAKANKITFNLGVDSLTSVSGVFGGDLDPTNGMYWTWQSGYINVKLEGTADKCPTRNHVFQFHIGGYQAPVNTMRKVELAISNKEEIHLNIALDSFLSQISLGENNKIMSPNEKAMEAIQHFIATFSISE